MAEIEAGQIWRGKGDGNTYRLRIIFPGRRGARLTAERIAGPPSTPIGKRLRCSREQLVAAYELEGKIDGG